MNKILSVLFVVMTLSVPVFADGIEISSNDSIDDVLENHIGKRVTIKLESGQELSGLVSKVTDDLTHLSELTGMEFYDAVIDNDQIAAVVIRRQ